MYMLSVAVQTRYLMSLLPPALLAEVLFLLLSQLITCYSDDMLL